MFVEKHHIQISPRIVQLDAKIKMQLRIKII